MSHDHKIGCALLVHGPLSYSLGYRCTCIGQVTDSFADSQDRTYIGTGMTASVSDTYDSALSANADIETDVGERRHDPMCPTFKYPDDHCQCRLIARVREDERAKRRDDLLWQDGYDTAKGDAVEAVKAQLAYCRVGGSPAIAQNKTVAAIEALGGERCCPPEHVDWCRDLYCGGCEEDTEYEALGGER